MTETVCVGVDGCPAGWIAVTVAPGDPARVSVLESIHALVDRCPSGAMIAVDMPIGLPERIGAGGRGPERAVRPLLGPRQSSVFSIPARAAVYAEDYATACRIALETSEPPKKISRQAFNIFAKIRELDRFLRTNPSWIPQVIEVHPEVAFWRLNGGRAMTLPKKVKSRLNPAGMDERRALLAASGYEVDFLTERPPHGAAEDDFLDAAAVALVAVRHARGEAEPFPASFGHDGCGLPVAIWA